MKVVFRVLCQFAPGLLPLIADFVHIFDGGFVDQGLLAAADLEGAAVIPLDASFDLLSVFQDKDHGSLGLDLLLQIKELGSALGRLMLLFLVVAVGRQTEGSYGGWPFARVGLSACRGFSSHGRAVLPEKRCE